jgi:succinate dehydrogenase/fumarate reductase flavoprotein subunit
MRRALLVLTVPAFLLVAGCASRSELQEAKALLEECRTDKVSAQTATGSCEERYAKEVRRWEDMDAVVADVVPNTLAEFKSEREEILKLVPEAARQEVGSYLDELTDAMGHGFQVLRDQSENALLELEVAQTKLDALQARTDTIGTQTSSINSTLEGSLREAIESQRAMRQQASALVATVQAFDRAHLSDHESDSRLKLNRNQRETIEQFHAKIIGELSALGAGPKVPDAAAPPVAADEPGSGG